MEVSETPAQSWDPGAYARNAAFVPALGRPLLDLLAPRPGERVLDLGCGDGVLTLELAARGCSVQGLDSSPAQVEAAKAKGLDARVADGEALGFEGEFDAVFSNAALHWMRQPDRVIDGVWRALKPGGRFVGEFGGEGCVAKIRRAAAAALARRGLRYEDYDPWYFPGPAEYRARLEARGFRVLSLEHFPRPTPLPGDVIGWLETFAGSFLAKVPGDGRREWLEEVRDALRPELAGADGVWYADYTRLRFAAEKPARAGEGL